MFYSKALLLIYFMYAAAAAAKSFQSCPTLCDPIDGSPPGSPTLGFSRPRILERVAISFSNAWKWKVKVKSLSCAQLLATPWTAAYQAPPSVGFSRQEYWSGVPLPSPTRPLGSSQYLVFKRLRKTRLYPRMIYCRRWIFPWVPLRVMASPRCVKLNK